MKRQHTGRDLAVGQMIRRTLALLSLEVVFEMVLVSLLDNDCILSHTDEYLITDIHPGDCKFILV